MQKWFYSYIRGINISQGFPGPRAVPGIDNHPIATLVNNFDSPFSILHSPLTIDHIPILPAKIIESYIGRGNAQFIEHFKYGGIHHWRPA